MSIDPELPYGVGLSPARRLKERQATRGEGR